jgi:uncharacterized protein with FMN-binding domain
MSRHVRRSRPGPSLATVQRRTRARRVLAFGGMLATVGGLVAARGAVAPAPGQALGATGLAAPVSQAAAGAPRHHRSHHRSHHRTHHAGHRPAHPSRSQPAAPSPSAKPTHAQPVRRTVTGDAFDVGYGTVQVRIVLVGHHLSDVTAISLPSGGHSGDISSYAGPRLRQEALAAQSARIDTVSGASYTSAGYAKSLQSALDKGARLS